MNILFITHYYHPHKGGVEKHTELLSQELIKKGHRVTIITKKHDSNLKTYEKRKNVEIHRITFPDTKILGLIRIWGEMFKLHKVFKSADIVHAHDVTLWILPLKVLNFKKIYSTFHGWEGQYPIPTKNKIAKKLARAISHKTISIGKYVDKHYGIKSKIISYGAVKPPKTFPKKDPKLIVYVGRLDKDTGLQIFLETFKKLKGYKIIFLGEGELRKDCTKIGEVKGFVNPEKYLLKAKYCAAGGYLTVLEALASKCIVLTAHDNELKKDYFKLTTFSKFIFSTNSPDKLVKKVKSTSKFNSLGQKWASNQSWEMLANTYLKLWALK